jgi:histidyl-tRNA synthetase
MVIGGGGRYDYLSARIAGKKIPAVGFYLNLDSVFEIMEDRGSSGEKLMNSWFTSAAKVRIWKSWPCNSLRNYTDKASNYHFSRNQRLHQESQKARQKGCALMLIIREDNIREGKILLKNLVKEHQAYVPPKITIPAILVARKALEV